MEERYHRHSTIITTNLIYDERHNFLGNESMVGALLSRVRHYCHTVTINGPSLRDPQGRPMMDLRDYVRRLLETYRATPGTCAPFGVRAAYSPPSCTNAACRSRRSRTR
jgi:IstB-like ATP binding protein